jgi:hypothetical protein
LNQQEEDELHYDTEPVNQPQEKKRKKLDLYFEELDINQIRSMSTQQIIDYYKKNKK